MCSRTAQPMMPSSLAISWSNLPSEIAIWSLRCLSAGEPGRPAELAEVASPRTSSLTSSGWSWNYGRRQSRQRCEAVGVTRSSKPTREVRLGRGNSAFRRSTRIKRGATQSAAEPVAVRRTVI